jgi:hypothetical protein
MERDAVNLKKWELSQCLAFGVHSMKANGNMTNSKWSAPVGYDTGRGDGRGDR